MNSRKPSSNFLDARLNFSLNSSPFRAKDFQVKTIPIQAKNAENKKRFKKHDLKSMNDASLKGFGVNKTKHFEKEPGYFQTETGTKFLINHGAFNQPTNDNNPFYKTMTESSTLVKDIHRFSRTRTVSDIPKESQRKYLLQPTRENDPMQTFLQNQSLEFTVHSRGNSPEQESQTIDTINYCSPIKNNNEYIHIDDSVLREYERNLKPHKKESPQDQSKTRSKLNSPKLRQIGIDDSTLKNVSSTTIRKELINKFNLIESDIEAKTMKRPPSNAESISFRPHEKNSINQSTNDERPVKFSEAQSDKKPIIESRVTSEESLSPYIFKLSDKNFGYACSKPYLSPSKSKSTFNSYQSSRFKTKGPKSNEYRGLLANTNLTVINLQDITSIEIIRGNVFLGIIKDGGTDFINIKECRFNERDVLELKERDKYEKKSDISVEQMQSNLSVMESQILFLIETIEHTEDLESIIVDLREEIDFLSNIIKEKDKCINDQKKTIESLFSSERNTKEELEVLKRKKKVSDNNIAFVIADEKNLKGVDAVEMESNDNELSHRTLTIKLNKLCEENTKLRKILKSNKSVHEITLRKLQNLKKAETEFETKLLEKEKELNSIRLGHAYELEKIRQEKLSLKEGINRFEKDLKERDLDNTLGSIEGKDLNIDKKNLYAEIQMLKRKNEEMLSDYKEEISHYLSKIKILDESIKILESQNVSKEKKIKEHNHEKAHLELEISELHRSVQEIKQLLEKASLDSTEKATKITRLLKENKDLEAKLYLVNSTLADQQKRLEEVVELKLNTKNAENSLNEKIQVLLRENSRLKQAFIELKHGKSLNLGKNDNLRKTPSELGYQEIIIDKDFVISNLNRFNSEKMKENERLLKENRILKEDIKGMRMRFEVVIKKVIENTYNEVIISSRRESGEKRLSTEEAEKHFNKLVDDYNKKVSILLEDEGFVDDLFISKSKDFLMNKKTEIVSSHTLLREKSKEIENLILEKKILIDEMKTYKIDFNKKLAEKESELESVKQELEKAKEGLYFESSKSNQFTSQFESLKSDENRWKEVIANKDSIITNLNLFLSEKSQAYEELNAKYQILQDLYNIELKSSNEIENKEVISKIRDEMAQLNIFISSKTKEFQSLLKKNNQAIAEKDNVISNLRLLINDKSTEIEELKKFKEDVDLEISRIDDINKAILGESEEKYKATIKYLTMKLDSSNDRITELENIMASKDKNTNDNLVRNISDSNDVNKVKDSLNDNKLDQRIKVCLQSQLNIIEFKEKAISEKKFEIDNLKTQLANSNEEYEKLNSLYKSALQEIDTLNLNLTSTKIESMKKLHERKESKFK